MGSNNATDAEIEAALEKVCSVLPDSLQDECKDLIEQYFPEIIQLITSGMSPQEICSEIGLCSNATAVAAPESGVECEICDFVMKEALAELSSNATDAEIEAVLGKVCGVLPNAIQGECNALIKQYLPEIIQLITSGLTPDEICSKLGLCKSVMTVAADVAAPESGAECAICEFVMKEAQSVLS